MPEDQTFLGQVLSGIADAPGEIVKALVLLAAGAGGTILFRKLRSWYLDREPAGFSDWFEKLKPRAFLDPIRVDEITDRSELKFIKYARRRGLLVPIPNSPKKLGLSGLALRPGEDVPGFTDWLADVRRRLSESPSGTLTVERREMVFANLAIMRSLLAPVPGDASKVALPGTRFSGVDISSGWPPSY